MNKCKKELVKRKKAGIIDRLESRMRGRSLLLTKYQQVQTYFYALCEKGSVVNSAIVMACDERVIECP